MIKGFKDYGTTKAYGQSEQLPRGAYVCKIVGAKVEDGNYGQYVKVALDIWEGDYAGFFQKKYNANTNEDKKWPCVYMLNVPKDDGSKEDNWTKRKFKTFTESLEDSNNNYHFDWDEGKFKGKLIGVLFNYREYEGNDGNVYSSANAAQVTSVENVHSGKYKLPEDKTLNKPTTNSAGFTSPAPSSNSGSEEDIPF